MSSWRSRAGRHAGASTRRNRLAWRGVHLERGTPMPQFEILTVVGSLRKDSFNKKLADALAKLAPSDFTLKQARIDDLPLYNQDDDGSPAASVKRLKKEISGAHGVIFVTP